MADRATAPHDAPARRIGPIAKVVYVLAVTIGALIVPSWLRPWVVPSLLSIQVVLLVGAASAVVGLSPEARGGCGECSSSLSSFRPSSLPRLAILPSDPA